MELLLESNNRRKRAAFIHNNKILSFFEDFKFASKLIGNIYIGKIVRLDANLQAAFIDYGNSRMGLLPIKLIHPKYFSIKNDDKQKILNNLIHNPHYTKNQKFFRQYDLQDLLKIGQKLVVQISKDEREKKGAFLSTYLNIFGNFLKYVPNSINYSLITGDNISITQKELLKKIMDKKKLQGTVYVNNIINISNDKIEKDLSTVLQKWEFLVKNLKTNTGEMLYKNQNFLQKIYQSHYFNNINKIITEGSIVTKNIVPNIITVKNVSVYNGFNIFQPYEAQILSSFQQVVQFKGGYLIISQSSAGTMIDVNYSKDDQYSYLKTNINAAKEIGLQVIRRNMFGLILIDFIDLPSNTDFSKVEVALKQTFKDDNAKISFGEISKFYIYQFTRQYADINVSRNDYFEYCAHCDGGLVLKTAVIAENLFSKVKYLSENSEEIEIYISSVIAEFIMNNMKTDFDLLSKHMKTKLIFVIVKHVSDNYVKIYKQDNYKAPE